MAKKRKDRNGKILVQLTVWIADAAFKELERRVAAANRNAGITTVSSSAVAGGILEKELK